MIVIEPVYVPGPPAAAGLTPIDTELPLPGEAWPEAALRVIQPVLADSVYVRGVVLEIDSGCAGGVELPCAKLKTRPDGLAETVDPVLFTVITTATEALPPVASEIETLVV